MRVRGLKLEVSNVGKLITKVAPHAGAWIETRYKNLCDRESAVAPHAGAWIETPVRRLFKLLLSVAPHAGALVEVQIAIQCWGVCIGVALAVGYETTADGRCCVVLPSV